MNRFYAPDISGQEFYVLNEEESKHANRVLRLQKGNAVELVDGRGGLFKGDISEVNPKACRIQITGHENAATGRSYHLHIGIAPTKNLDRLEWFLEKSAEIGIDEISLLQCQRSERKEVNNNRLQKLLVSAMKQSLTYWLPLLHPVRPFKSWIGEERQGIRAIAHCLTGNELSIKSLTEAEAGQRQRAAFDGVTIDNFKPRYTILIGPEGDFSPEEIELAGKQHYAEINLGSNRLRTETAGIVVCAELSLLLRGN